MASKQRNLSHVAARGSLPEGCIVDEPGGPVRSTSAIEWYCGEFDTRSAMHDDGRVTWTNTRELREYMASVVVAQVAALLKKHKRAGFYIGRNEAWIGFNIYLDEREFIFYAEFVGPEYLRQCVRGPGGWKRKSPVAIQPNIIDIRAKLTWIVKETMRLEFKRV